MAVYCVIKQEKISGNKRDIIGIYSSWNAAWQNFATRIAAKKSPLTGGIFRYNNLVSFEGAVGLMEPAQTSIVIYTHDLFDIYIAKRQLDQPITI